MPICTYYEEYINGTLSEEIIIDMKKETALYFLDNDLFLLEKIFLEYIKNKNQA